MLPVLRETTPFARLPLSLGTLWRAAPVPGDSPGVYRTPALTGYECAIEYRISCRIRGGTAVVRAVYRGRPVYRLIQEYSAPQRSWPLQEIQRISSRTVRIIRRKNYLPLVMYSLGNMA